MIQMNEETVTFWDESILHSIFCIDKSENISFKREEIDLSVSFWMSTELHLTMVLHLHDSKDNRCLDDAEDYQSQHLCSFH
jgi:hypothetical protein